MKAAEWGLSASLLPCVRQVCIFHLGEGQAGFRVDVPDRAYRNQVPRTGRMHGTGRMEYVGDCTEMAFVMADSRRRRAELYGSSYLVYERLFRSFGTMVDPVQTPGQEAETLGWRLKETRVTRVRGATPYWLQLSRPRAPVLARERASTRANALAHSALLLALDIAKGGEAR